MTANRWSARQLGLATGVSGAAIENWLKGDSIPSAINLKKICDVLGVDIADAFVEETLASPERVAA